VDTFRTLRFGKLRWTLRSDANVDALLRLLHEPEQFLRDPATQIKSSRVVTIAKVRGLPEVPDLILRRLNYGKFLHRLRDVVRPTRAHRAQRNSMLLHRAGIKTPLALAAGEERLLRWPRVAYLVTEEVPGATTLASLHARGPIAPELLRRVAVLIAKLHGQGLSHRDLKWTNILFDKRMEPWLIDLDGVREFKTITDYQARLDLLSLARSFPGWKDVLKLYCEERDRPGDLAEWTTELRKRLPQHP
jgi:tRNA A-37 threonylcarbamoyl transferase component Bud32